MRQLLLALLPVLARAPAITAVAPAANAVGVLPATALVVSFSQPLLPAAGQALHVFSEQAGAGAVATKQNAALHRSAGSGWGRRPAGPAAG